MDLFDKIWDHLAKHIEQPFWGWIDSAMVRKRGRIPRAHAWIPQLEESSGMSSICGTTSSHTKLGLIPIGERPADWLVDMNIETDRMRCASCVQKQRAYKTTLKGRQHEVEAEARNWNTHEYRFFRLAAPKLMHEIGRITEQKRRERITSEARAIAAPPLPPPADPLEDDWIPKIPVRHIVAPGTLAVERSIIRKEFILSLKELVGIAVSLGQLPPVPDNAVVDLVDMGTSEHDGRRENFHGLRLRWLERPGVHVDAAAPKNDDTRPPEPVKLPEIKLRARPEGVIARRATGASPKCANGCGTRLTDVDPPGAYCQMCAVTLAVPP